MWPLLARPRERKCFDFKVRGTVLPYTVSFLLIRYTLLLLFAVGAPSKAAQYLPSIQQRWDASDLVCTGRASSAARTGQTKKIGPIEHRASSDRSPA